MTDKGTVSKEEAEKVLAAVRETFKLELESGYKEPNLRDESNDWAMNDDGAWFIFWEEGPYDWTMRFWEQNRDNFPNLLLETVCGWGLLGIYKVVGS